jgi:hypothetical protein
MHDQIALKSLQAPLVFYQRDSKKSFQKQKMKKKNVMVNLLEGKN